MLSWYISFYLFTMSTRCIFWDKGGRSVRLTTLPPSCVVVMKSGKLKFLESSGPLQACNGTLLRFTLFTSSSNFFQILLIYHDYCCFTFPNARNVKALVAQRVLEIWLTSCVNSREPVMKSVVTDSSVTHCLRVSWRILPYRRNLCSTLHYKIFLLYYTGLYRKHFKS
jgi:hypothetical protein